MYTYTYTTMARIYNRLQETSCGLKDEYIRPRAIPLYYMCFYWSILPRPAMSSLFYYFKWSSYNIGIILIFIYLFVGKQQYTHNIIQYI